MKKRILLTLLTVLLLCGAWLGLSVLSAGAQISEPTDVYWFVNGNTLILSAEQGNSGLTKWSKDAIAQVDEARDVPWNGVRDDITTVMFYSPIAPTSTAFWFAESAIPSFSAVGSDGVLYLDMSFVTDAQRMFTACEALTALDLSGTRAPLLTNVESMFNGCAKLKALDISFMDGAPLTNMMNVFYDCGELAALDVSGLDISRVTDFTGVFMNCASLKTLDLTALDGRNLETLDSSFYGCAALTSLTFGDNFTCAKVTSMQATFQGCAALSELDLSRFSTAKVTSMQATFQGCAALSELDLSRFSTAKVTSMKDTFRGCDALTTLTLGEGFVCTAVTDMSGMFWGCDALPALDTSKWQASGVKDMSLMFSQCKALATLDLSGFDGAKPVEIDSMFSGAASLKAIDLTGIDMSQIDTLYNLFSGCAALESFDLSELDTSAVTNMMYMFKSCTALTSFSFVGVDISSVATMEAMFAGCTALASIDFTGIDTSGVTTLRSLLSQCTALTQVDLSDLDLVEGQDSSNLLWHCWGLRRVTAPKSIPASVSIVLGGETFYTGSEEITELTSAHEGTSVVRKFTIKYFWKNGTDVTQYYLTPDYYYYGTGATINANISVDGYIFGGWTRNNLSTLVSAIAATDAGDISLYAKMTALQPVASTAITSPDVNVTYGEAFAVNVQYTTAPLHTYRIVWYRTEYSAGMGGSSIYDLRDLNGFTVEAYRLNYGIEMETQVYFYCEITATRTDNGLSAVTRSRPIGVYINRAQAEFVQHPTAIEGLIYTGSAQSVTTSGMTNHQDASVKPRIVFSFFSDGSFYENNKTTKAGTGTVYYKIADSSYYKGTPLYSLTYTIAGAAPQLSFESADLTQSTDYTGGAASIVPPTVTLLNGDRYEGEILYSYTGTESGTGLPVNAGTYTVSAHIPAAGNYTAASSTNTVTLTVSKVASQLDAAPSAVTGLVYSGTAIPLAQAGSTQDGTIEYSTDNAVWSAALPTGKNVGEYTVYYRIAGDQNHLDSAAASFTVSIGKKQITVTADDRIACLNMPLPTLTYTVVGLCADDALLTAPTLTTDAALDTLGAYGITVGGADAGENYTVAYVGGTLTVSEHVWNAGEITTAPTCTQNGVKTYTCQNDATHAYTEAVNANGHVYGAVCDAYCNTCNEARDAQAHTYDNACDADCHVCGEARTVAAHSDADNNELCDHCGAEVPEEGLSGGAIAGIVIGSVAAVGIGGFSVLWFVIKKRKWSDLVKIFKKQ